MHIVVRKYGGTSVADAVRIREVARSVARDCRHRPTVVVVSAQGGTTDALLRQAADVGEPGAGRETDQLLATGECASAALLTMALRALGAPAVSLTGGQAGISVTGPAGEGRIAEVATDRIRGLLATGQVVVVAGFQGIGADGDVVTLGRGGSDTTAVALAAALGAGRCEIYTDVDGVYSADPRIVPAARPLREVAVEAMVELAFAGAAVLHSRAVDLAAARNIEVRVRSAFHDGPETVIAKGSGGHMLERYGVVAVAHDMDVTRVLIHRNRPSEDLAVAVLGVFARHDAPIDLVARSGPHEDEFRMGFTMRRTDVARLAAELHQVVAAAGGTVALDEEVAKVSLIGSGLLSRPRHTAQMLSALAGAGITTSWVSTSQLRTSVTVPADRAQDAVLLLHKEFELDQERPAGERQAPADSSEERNASCTTTDLSPAR